MKLRELLWILAHTQPATNQELTDEAHRLGYVEHAADPYQTNIPSQTRKLHREGLLIRRERESPEGGGNRPHEFELRAPPTRDIRAARETNADIASYAAGGAD